MANISEKEARWILCESQHRLQQDMGATVEAIRCLRQHADAYYSLGGGHHLDKALELYIMLEGLLGDFASYNDAEDWHRQETFQCKLGACKAYLALDDCRCAKVYLLQAMRVLAQSPALHPVQRVQRELMDMAAALRQEFCVPSSITADPAAAKALLNLVVYLAGVLSVYSHSLPEQLRQADSSVSPLQAAKPGVCTPAMYCDVIFQGLLDWDFIERSSLSIDNPTLPVTPQESSNTLPEEPATVIPLSASEFIFTSNEDLQLAVDMWCHPDTRDMAEAEFGHISMWNTSLITNMKELFRDKRDFNDDISAWDVSNVFDMNGMFYYASSFNQPIGDWDVSQVTDMRAMFSEASTFNHPIGQWNVSHVTDMYCMFTSAYSFNQPVGKWDVSRVADMGYMFAHAASFNQPMEGWNVSQVTNMRYMFCSARVFNQPIGGWDIGNVTDVYRMLHGARSFNPVNGNPIFGR